MSIRIQHSVDILLPPNQDIERDPDQPMYAFVTQDLMFMQKSPHPPIHVLTI